MKIKLILLFLFFTTNLICQNYREAFSVKFYDGKNIEQLQFQNLINDIIKLNDCIIYLKINNPISQQEFFRYDDTTYIFREKINENIVAEGNLQFEKIQPAIIDTIILLDPEGIKNDTSILTQGNLSKMGLWKEVNEKGELWQGQYVKNKKYGRWVSINTEPKKVLDFEADKIIPQPNKEELNAQFVNYFLDKKWTCCVRTIYHPNGSILESKWNLQVNRKHKCFEVGAFTFYRNGSFIFEEFIEKANDENDLELEEESFPTFRYGGKGQWRILENGDLQLEFFDKKIDKLKINYFGKDGISLEILKIE